MSASFDASASSSDDLAVVRALIEAGIPVVVCRPHRHYSKCGPDCTQELDHPPGWHMITAEEAGHRLSRFRPGTDTLAMVSGHGIDVEDVDTKAGGSLDHLPAAESFGQTETPSGGTHLFVRSTGFGKIGNWCTSAGFVGDYCGGTPDGAGRALVYLPGSTRPKYPDGAYTWTTPLDLDRLLEAEPDDNLIAALMAAGASRNGEPGKPARSKAEVDEFMAEHAVDPECAYGAAAVERRLAEAADIETGDPVTGRHAWFLRSAARVVELVKAGCCWAADLEALVEALDEIKPEGGTDAQAAFGWAIANTEATTGCDRHRPPPPSTSLTEVRKTWRRWMGPAFDLQFLDTVLAVAAAGIHLDGDPAWLQIIGGPGAGKTETAGALSGAGCHVTSTLSGEAALLSGSPAKQRAKDATGGLLRVVGERGVLVIKDFTSVLSMKHEKRAEVLAALREVYDGRWSRNLGTDGGRTLKWEGRCVVISCVTGVYDEHLAVIASMGDRFLLLRLDTDGAAVRRHATRQAMSNSGSESSMRPEMAAAAGGFLVNLDPSGAVGDLPDEVMDEVADLADLVARCRSEVARDFKGEPQYAHAPEMPTRVAKQLVAVVRGGLMIGLGRDEALDIARRLVHDSIPPARRKVLLAVHEAQGRSTKHVSEATGMSRTTADRVLQELAMHGLLRREEDEAITAGGKPYTRWTWFVDDSISINLDALRPGYGRPDHVPGNSSAHAQGDDDEEDTVPPAHSSDEPSGGSFPEQGAAASSPSASESSSTQWPTCHYCGTAVTTPGRVTHAGCDRSREHMESMRGDSLDRALAWLKAREGK